MAILHFQNAVNAHVLWSQKFADYLEGHHVSAEFDHVHRDDLCVIGQWLHGEGDCYQHLSQFAVVKTIHRELHALAGKMVQAKAEANRVLLEELTVQMNQIRHDLFIAWDALNDLVGAYE